MSFWDHLEELRGTLFRSILAVCLLSIIFLSIKGPLFKAVLWPATQDFILYRWLGLDFNMSLINIDISAQFFVHLKMALLCGVVIAFPYKRHIAQVTLLHESLHSARESRIIPAAHL